MSNRNMNIIAVIPVRMAASRFPGKPMAKIMGTPMIEHVFKRVSLSKSVADVYVATCDEEIYNYISSLGGKVVMTSDCHERCSDRCAEAMLKIEEMTGERVDILVMVQGDEPLTHPDMIDEALAPMLDDENIPISNLTGEIKTQAEFENPNEVKVVMDKEGNALYLSREPIPSKKKYKSDVPQYKQIPVIPFKRDFLIQYNELGLTELEIIESVDMLRVIENGYKLKMIKTDYVVKAVDIPDDVAIVEALMVKDKLYQNML